MKSIKRLTEDKGSAVFFINTFQQSADCEKTIHNTQFITGDKNKRFPFLSSIILDIYYDGIHAGQKQKPTRVLLSRGSY
jgi:hypothetical protein